MNLRAAPSDGVSLDDEDGLYFVRKGDRAQVIAVGSFPMPADVERALGAELGEPFHMVTGHFMDCVNPALSDEALRRPFVSMIFERRRCH